MAGRCADVFVDENAAAAIAAVRQMCQQQHGMAEADVDALLDDIGKRTKEVASLFEINIGSAADYEAILKKANEALVEITLQSQQQATQLQEQTQTLEQQNQELKKQATTDGLTGLANRARFDAFLAEQFEHHRASGKPLALLLLDVDKFKAINDKHGHPAGDKVLKRARQAARQRRPRAGPGRPLRRRGAGAGAARHEPRDGRRDRREHPPGDRGQARARSGRRACRSPRASASRASSPAARSASPPTCSRPPTWRSTTPSARAATASACSPCPPTPTMPPGPVGASLPRTGGQVPQAQRGIEPRTVFRATTSVRPAPKSEVPVATSQKRPRLNPRRSAPIILDHDPKPLPA